MKFEDLNKEAQHQALLNVRNYMRGPNPKSDEADGLINRKVILMVIELNKMTFEKDGELIEPK
jgi:hypothetical protein